jgi:pyruvate,orthophosphate dikinase
MGAHVLAFGDGSSEGDPKRRDLLGGKGAGLAEMARLGLPVPPGFTITTEVCTRFQGEGTLPEDVRAEVRAAIAKLEESLGRSFGGESPLLVSVRSGARASMPGMMDTILNLGLTREGVRAVGAATGNARFAWDSYRRFLAMQGSVALGVDKHHFDDALEGVRLKAARTRGLDVTRFNPEELRRAMPDSELTAEVLEEAATAFEAVIEKHTGKAFPQDPWEQLWAAITGVFKSWNNPRAITYRRMHEIPDSWGTACNVQAMVFGNLGATSGTGVAFTRNPSTGENVLYGEWLPNAQGEDVVAGIRTPLPIAKSEKSKGTSLEESSPEVFAEFVAVARRLEGHFRDLQDIEFTIQEGRLFMLQCRSGKRTAKAAVRIAVELVREGILTKNEALQRVEAKSLDQLLHPTLDPEAPKELVARGLPASPGAASGQVVFDADEAERKAMAGLPVLLVRTETSPEDIHGMKAARGILTARGGMTSHAAVVARGMGKPCVAGTSAIHVDERAGQISISVATDGGANRIVIVKRGEVLTIDGGAGAVYLGAVPTVPAVASDEFLELMGWADEARKLKVRANADTPVDARVARSFGAEGIGLCRTEHMFFDDERIAAVREMILADEKPARERALAKLLPHQRGDFIGIFREMSGLPVTIRLLDPPLHEFLPDKDSQLEALAATMKVPLARLKSRVRELHEFNPMLGHRGCRLAITYPEIYAMQVRAILEAAVRVQKEGVDVQPEIMIPLAIAKVELDRMKAIVDVVAKSVFEAESAVVPYLFGTMIELPRAALRAHELAETAEFFSFGTNDLTQATLGLSRDDAGRFLPAYVEQGILEKDPFVSVDVDGVGELVREGKDRGRKTRPLLKVGVCGEHGGDPSSVRFFHQVGLDYVSCSPFRVAIARLAAAQAALEGPVASTA